MEIPDADKPGLIQRVIIRGRPLEQITDLELDKRLELRPLGAPVIIERKYESLDFYADSKCTYLALQPREVPLQAVAFVAGYCITNSSSAKITKQTTRGKRTIGMARAMDYYIAVQFYQKK